MDILQSHSVQSEEDAMNTSFTNRLRTELSAGGEPIGTFCNKRLSRICIFSKAALNSKKQSGFNSCS